MTISRRTFLKASGAAGATIAIASATPPVLASLFEQDTGEAAPILEEKWVPSVCLQCPAGCGIRVRVVNGRAVKIEGNPLHPINEGRLCPKGQSGLQFLYDPDRIKGPLRRVGERSSGQWEPISWETAIAEVAGKLKEIRDRGEAHTLLFMSGRNRGQMGGFIDRFVAAYGSPNSVGHSSICEDGSPQAHYLTQGFKAYAGYDWVNTNYVVSFGGSFLEAWRPTTLLLRSYGHMRRGRPNRFKLVHVDTRYSVTAAKADEWIAIRPGTDGALALALAHVIIRDNLYDHEFVENRTHGFEEWSHLVLAEYPPEWAEKETGVPANTIERIAREFATSKPAIAAGARGTSMQPYGVYTRTAIHALNALVGSIDVPGGVVVQKAPPLTKDPDVVQDDVAKAGVKQPRIDYAGTKRYPLAGKVYQNIPEFATGRCASLKRLPKEKRCLKSRVTERGRRDTADFIRVRGHGAASLQEGQEEREGADPGRVLPDDGSSSQGGNQAFGKGPRTGSCPEEDGAAGALWARSDGGLGEGLGGRRPYVRQATGSGSADVGRGP